MHLQTYRFSGVFGFNHNGTKLLHHKGRKRLTIISEYRSTRQYIQLSYTMAVAQQLQPGKRLLCVLDWVLIDQ